MRGEDSSFAGEATNASLQHKTPERYIYDNRVIVTTKYSIAAAKSAAVIVERMARPGD